MYVLALEKSVVVRSTGEIPLRKPEDYFKEACLISRSIGRNASRSEELFVELSDSYLSRVWCQIQAQTTLDNYDVLQNHLDRMISIVELNASEGISNAILSAIYRLKAIVFGRQSNWTSMVKALNLAISKGSREQGLRECGFVDLLILLVEAYSNLSSQEDALRSAKLAVSISHEELDRDAQGGDLGVPKRIAIGPMLPMHVAVAVSYHSLAVQLDRSGFHQISRDWHQRALNVALQFDIEETIVDFLQAEMTRSLIEASNARSGHGLSPGFTGKSPTQMMETHLGHLGLGASKSLDDVDLAKQRRHLNISFGNDVAMNNNNNNNSYHNNHRANEGNHRAISRNKSEDGESSSISDENEPTRRGFLRAASRDQGHAPVTNVTLSLQNFNDSIVETVDLTRRDQLANFKGERPRSALPRLIHDTVQFEQHGGHGDGDSLTMESGTGSMHRSPASNHLPTNDMNFNATYHSGIDQSTAGLKPVRVQSALSRLGADYTNPPRREHPGGDKAVSLVNVNVRGGDVFPQGSGLIGGASGDYSAELFPPLPSTVPPSSNVAAGLNSNANQMYSLRTNQPVFTRPAGSQLNQGGFQAPTGPLYPSTVHFQSTYPWPAQPSHGLYNAGYSAAPQVNRQFDDSDAYDAEFNASANKGVIIKGTPEPPTTPYPLLLMPRIQQQHPFSSSQALKAPSGFVPDHATSEPETVPRNDITTAPTFAQSRPKAGAIIQIAANPVDNPRHRSPKKSQKSHKKKADSAGKTAVAVINSNASLQQESVAVSVALSWERIVQEGSRSDHNINALSSLLQNDSTIGTIGLNGDSSLLPNSRLESEWTNKLRDLIAKARSEEREILLGEIVSEEKMRRLNLFKVGMKVQRVGQTSELARTESLDKKTVHQQGTVVNIRPHLLCLDIQFDAAEGTRDNSQLLEKFVSIYDVAPCAREDEIELPDIVSSEAGFAQKVSNDDSAHDPPAASHSPSNYKPGRGNLTPSQATGSGVMRGKIESIRVNGTFDVVFGNGSRAVGVAAEGLRIMKMSQLRLNELHIRSLMSLAVNPDGTSSTPPTISQGPGSIIAGLDFKRAYPWLNSQENSRCLRATATRDMHQFMKCVRDKTSHQKKIADFGHVIAKINKIVLIQAVARGYVARRKLPGVRRQLARFRSLLQKEHDLKLQQLALEEKMRKHADMGRVSPIPGPMSLGVTMHTTGFTPHSLDHAAAIRISSNNVADRVPLVVQLGPATNIVDSAAAELLAAQRRELKLKEDQLGAREAELQTEVSSLLQMKKDLEKLEQSRQLEKHEMQKKEDGYKEQMKLLEELTSQLEQRKLREALLNEELQKLRAQEEIESRTKLEDQSAQQEHSNALKLELQTMKEQLRSERELLRVESQNVQSQRDALRKEWNECANEKMELTRIADLNKSDFLKLQELQSTLAEQQRLAAAAAATRVQESDIQRITEIVPLSPKSQPPAASQLSASLLDQYSIASQDNSLSCRETEVESLLREELDKLQERLRGYGASVSNGNSQILDPQSIDQLIESNREREARLQSAVVIQESKEADLQKQLQLEHDRLQAALRRMVAAGVQDPELLQYLDNSAVPDDLVAGGSVLSIVSCESAKFAIINFELDVPEEDQGVQIGESGFERDQDSPGVELVNADLDRDDDPIGLAEGSCDLKQGTGSVRDVAEGSFGRGSAHSQSYSKSLSFDQSVELTQSADILGMVAQLPSHQYLTLSILTLNAADIVDVSSSNADHVRVSESNLIPDNVQKYSGSSLFAESKVFCVSSPLNNIFEGGSSPTIDEVFVSESVVINILRRDAPQSDGFYKELRPSSRTEKSVRSSVVASTAIPIHSLLLMAGSAVAEPVKFSLSHVHPAVDAQPPIDIYVRASFIDLKTFTNLFVALWEVHLSWCVQCLLIHAAAAEQMGDMVVENVDEMTEQQRVVSEWRQRVCVPDSKPPAEVIANPTPRSNLLVDELAGGQYMDHIEGKIGEVAEFVSPISLISRDALLVCEHVNDCRRIFVHGVRRSSDDGDGMPELNIQPGDELVAINGTVFEGETMEAVHSWIRRHTSHAASGSASMTMPVSIRVRRYFGHNLSANKPEIANILSSSRALFDKFASSTVDVEIALEQLLQSMDLSTMVIRSRSARAHNHLAQAQFAVETDCVSELSNEMQSLAAVVYSFLAAIPTRNLSHDSNMDGSTSTPIDRPHMLSPTVSAQPLVLSRQGTGNTLGSAGEMLEVAGCNPVPGMLTGKVGCGEESVEDLLVTMPPATSQPNSPRHVPGAGRMQVDCDPAEGEVQDAAPQIQSLLPTEDIWTVVEPVLRQAFIRFVSDIVCSDVDFALFIADVDTVSNVVGVCRAVMEVVLSHIERFDWDIWWQKRDYWLEMTDMKEFTTMLLKMDRAMFQLDESHDPQQLPQLSNKPSRDSIEQESEQQGIGFPRLLRQVEAVDVYDATAMCVLATVAMRLYPPESIDMQEDSPEMEVPRIADICPTGSIHTPSSQEPIAAVNAVENVSMITEGSDDLIFATEPEGGGELMELLLLFFKQVIELHVKWCVHKLFMTAFIERHASDVVHRTRNAQSASGESDIVSAVTPKIGGNAVASGNEAVLGDVEALSVGPTSNSSRRRQRKIMLESARKQSSSFRNANEMFQSDESSVESAQPDDLEESSMMMAPAAAANASENFLQSQIHAGRVFYSRFVRNLNDMKAVFMDNFTANEDDNMGSNDTSTYIDGVCSGLFASLVTIFNRLFKHARRVYLQRNLDNADLESIDEIRAACTQQLDMWVQCKSGLHALLSEYLSKFVDDLGTDVASQLNNLNSRLHSNLDAFGSDLFQSMQLELDQFEWNELWQRQAVNRERGESDLIAVRVEQSLATMLVELPTYAGSTLESLPGSISLEGGDVA